jgi:hypothetical protein
LSDVERRPARARWIAIVKLVLAALILWLVGRAVPWSDRLSYGGDQGARQWTGRIVGDWKAARVRFQFDAPQVAQELPEEWNVQGAEVSAVDVERGDATAWQPGMPRVFRDVEPGGLCVALLLALVGIAATSLRWWRLLNAARCPARLFDALRLTFIGFFFNIVVPGLTGGDLIKAVMIARSHPERRAAAALSVLVDRLIGVFVLVAMGAVAIAAVGRAFPYPRTPIFAGLGAALLAAALYQNPAVRRAIGFERLLGRLPFAKVLRQLDDAVTVYSKHPREFALALLFSFANQCCVITALCVLGRSFGEDALDLANYVVAGAIGNLASAVPITPGGVGVTEMLYGELFQSQGGSWTLGLAVSLAWRVCMISVGLCGGLFLLVPGGKMTDAERAAVRSASSATPS